MASMQDVQPRVGSTDLLAMPEDGRRYEIHGGELVVVPSPLLRHQIAAVRLVTLLDDYRRRSGGLAVTAPFDIVFDEHVLEQGAYRRAEVATAGDTVRSILLPDLTFAAAGIFTFP